MNITLERSVPLEISPAELDDRLKRWAEANGFRYRCESAGRWMFHRGSQWCALYTFDIRKVPTQVVVEFIGEPPAMIHCSLNCRSWLQFPTPWEKRTLENDLHALIAHLREITRWRGNSVGDNVYRPEEAV